MTYNTAYNEAVLDSLHEAGHAVVTLALGGQLDRVTTMASHRAADCPLDPWAAAVVCVAGGLAARTFGPAVRGPSRELSPQDQAVAEHHLQKIGLDYTGYRHRLEQEAQTLLLNNDRYVKRVAEALRSAGELSGADVERICAGEPVQDVIGRPSARRAALTTPAVLDPGEVRCTADVFPPVDERPDWLIIGKVPGGRSFDARGATYEATLDEAFADAERVTGSPVVLDMDIYGPLSDVDREQIEMDEVLA